MIDSGASSSVVPKPIIDKQGIEYESLEKEVVHLDGTIVNTIGVIKKLSLTLHACPNFSILQDIYVIELPLYFAIWLAMDFTTKIGGYLSFDCSHMLFRNIYATKDTIKSEPIAKDHLEPYVPTPINTNCTLSDLEDCLVARDLILKLNTY